MRVCACPSLSSLCLSIVFNLCLHIVKLLAGVCACVWLIGAYPNSTFDPLRSLGSLTVSIAPSLQTAQFLQGLKVITKRVHSRLHQCVMQSLFHMMENVIQQSTGASVACFNTGMDDASWTYFFPHCHIVHSEFPYDG